MKWESTHCHVNILILEKKCHAGTRQRSMYKATTTAQYLVAIQSYKVQLYLCPLSTDLIYWRKCIPNINNHRHVIFVVEFLKNVFIRIYHYDSLLPAAKTQTRENPLFSKALPRVTKKYITAAHLCLLPYKAHHVCNCSPRIVIHGKWHVYYLGLPSWEPRHFLYECHHFSIGTVYPKKYAHGFVVLCFVVVMQSFIMNSHEVFIHIHQGCFAGTGAIVRLPQCQWSKPDGYWKISQCITTTKHSKAKTVCIFRGIYCNSTVDLLGPSYPPMNRFVILHLYLKSCLKIKGKLR